MQPGLAGAGAGRKAGGGGEREPRGEGDQHHGPLPHDDGGSQHHPVLQVGFQPDHQPGERGVRVQPGLQQRRLQVGLLLGLHGEQDGRLYSVGSPVRQVRP